ncbi:MAG: ATP-binding protein [Clostridium sp.]|jgi:sensor histidine kinase regulating citrate/malate metabolism
MKRISLKHKPPKTTVQKNLYRSFLLLSAVLLLCSMGTTLYLDITRQRKDMDRTIRGASAYIASMPQVRTMLQNGYPDPAVTKDLDSLSEYIPDISVIVICNTDGLRFYHTDRHKTGESFVDGDETAILQGSAPYITTGYGTHGMQRRAFHAIRDEQDTIIGFVMVSLFTATISARHRYIFLLNGLIFLIMILVSLSLTHTILIRLRHTLLGFDPEELVRLYTRQDEVINSIDEGLIATDQDGKILFVNQRAEFLFSCSSSIIGTYLKDLYPQTSITRILATGEEVPKKTHVVNGRTLLIREIPIHESERTAIRGILLLLFDRTEILSLSDELSGAQNMLDTLRAFNHEFLNKLHIILGYLQIGQIQKAMEFITNSSLVSSQSVRETANRIRVPQLCALIIGKMMHAAELGIRLDLSPGSGCREQDWFLPTDACGTILGNLLENSIEELSRSDVPQDAVREISLGIFCDPGCTILTCEDTGGGIPPSLLPSVFEKGISTKGENRGTGLFLIRQLAEQYGGDISIDNEPGEGVCFTITFLKPGSRKEI